MYGMATMQSILGSSTAISTEKLKDICDIHAEIGTYSFLNMPYSKMFCQTYCNVHNSDKDIVKL